jgi:hypothetical protein
MSDYLVVKVELLRKPRLKQEMVRMHTRDFSIDLEKPIDDAIQAALGNNFKGYFRAQQIQDQLVLLKETDWTEWNKGRLG